MGKHAELLARNGVYAKLVARQLTASAEMSGGKPSTTIGSGS